MTIRRNDVEVKMAPDIWMGGWQIVDFNTANDTFTVQICSNVGIQCEEYKSECVRFAHSYDTTKSFCVGDEVELWRNFGFPGWVKARICSIKGDYYVCDYLVRDQYSKDVVGLSDLRPVNTNAPLSTDNFFRTNFELPESIHSFCENNPNQHEDFLRACEAFKVWYCKGELIILSQKDYSRRVFMLKDFHIRMLEQKVEMIQKINELRDSLEKAKMIAENNSEKFSVDPSLLKYVVGAKGANISKARKIPGVIQIEICDDPASVSIFAESKEAAQKAKQILEFCEENYLVPRKMVGRLIGQKGKSIQDIVDKSKIIKAVVLTKEDAADSGIEGVDEVTTAFKFIGTKSNISNARALMDYIVHSHKEIDSIMDTTVQIEGQIKDYKVDSKLQPPTLQPSSGYSSDSDQKKAKTEQKPKKTKKAKPANGKRADSINNAEFTTV